jgi:hypothetical protein
VARERAGDPWRSPEERTPIARVILWTTDRLAFAFAALGIRYPEFRELLRARIVLALRPSSGPSVWGIAGIALAVAMSFVFGIGTGLLGLGEDTTAWITVSQSVLVVLVGTLIFQFLANVLVDPTDIGVVAPHPVADRTLLAVRLAEIFAYLLVFVASFTAGNVVVAVFGKPPLAVLLVYPLLSLLCGFTTLGLVALLFGACLRIAGPVHFQRVTLWVQVLGGALLFSGLQLFRLLELEPLLERLHRWRYLWPPCQYAELFRLTSGERGELGPSLAAVVVPFAALALTFRFATRSFVAGVQGTLGAPLPVARWEEGWVARIGRRIVRGEQRAAFDFAAALARREPHFLRGVLPQLAMFQAMALGMGVGLDRDIGFYVPFSAAFLAMVLPNVLLQAQGTSHPEARALFASAPVADPSALLRGGVKALLVQWFGLPALAVLGVQLVVGGLEVLPRSVLALELALAVALVLARRFELPLLFTQPVRVGQTGAENFGLFVLSGFAMIALGAVHVALSLHPLALGAGLALAGWLDVVLWRRLDGLRLADHQRPRLPPLPVAHG